MGVLSCRHPDIREFVGSKKAGGLRNFNISVGFDAAFFDSLGAGKDYPLVNPRDGSVWAEIAAGDLWREVAEQAWATGDPGVLFMDEIDRLSTLPGMGPIEATNPCGEQPLLPYESCNLGSINLSRCVKRRELDEGMLTNLVRTGVDFLDAIIDVNRFPIPEIQEMNLAHKEDRARDHGVCRCPHQTRDPLRVRRGPPVCRTGHVPHPGGWARAIP